MNKILLISLALSSFALAGFLSQDNSDDKLKYEFSAIIPVTVYSFIIPVTVYSFDYLVN